jgi:hypothetical protein
MVVEGGVQILGQLLQDLIRLYVSYLTFRLDIAAGIIIGISSGLALVAFLKILHTKQFVLILCGRWWNSHFYTSLISVLVCCSPGLNVIRDA